MAAQPPPPEGTGSSEGLAGRVVRGAGFAGGGYLFAQILNLGVYVVLSRLLEPADFGIYASATVLIAFGVLITESGMHSAVVQRQDRIHEAQSTAVGATFVGGLILALLGLAIAPLLGALFDNGEVTSLAAVASGLIFVNTLAVVPNAILQRRFSTVRLTVIDPLEVVAFGIVAIALAAHGSGPWALLIGQYAGIATSTTLAWALARWRPMFGEITFGMWRELASYGRHILVSTAIFKFGVQAADTVIVGRTLGPASLGQFRYAFRVATLPWTVLLAGAGYVIFPALSRIAADRERLRGAFLRSLRWMVAFGFPAGLVLVPLGPPLIVLAFGDVWHAAGLAAMAMCAYAGGNAIIATVSELLKANGTPAPLITINLATTIVTAAAMLALVPFGLTAAAAGLSIGALAGAGVAIMVVRRDLGVPLATMSREIWAPAVAATAMALTVLPLDRLLLHAADHGTVVGLLLLLGEGVLCIALFAAFVWPLAPRLPAELRAAFGELRDRRGKRIDPLEEPDPTLMAP
jgi:O-antigen/teichoic acid export membrane protein